MTRTRLAVALAVVAGISVVGTGSLAVATYVGGDSPPAAHRLVVRDPGSGATLRVPARRWQVRDRADRISYGEVSVRGPAVLDAGYCRAETQGSFRALVGFTDASFEAWLEGVGGGASATSSGTSRQRMELADGSSADLWRAGLLLAKDECSSGAVDVAMVRTGDVAAVLVRDVGDPGSLTQEQADAVLSSLRVP